MFKKIWQWLKNLVRKILGKKSEISPTITETATLAPLEDADCEFFFRQLLEGVAHGWQTPRIVKFFEGMKARVTNAQWVEWLNRFGEKVLASKTQNRELAMRMVQLGEMTQSIPSIQDISTTALEIGRQLLTRDHSGVVWEYEGPDAKPRIPPPQRAEITSEDIPEDEVITVEELFTRLQQNPDLVQLIAQQFGIETNDPQVIIDAVIEQLDLAEKSPESQG
ncbi:MAG TPA: hypothetical protein DEG17_22905 [Cyanobacteria bacterium UBA11149]|nr:hypothetical protein [Cyanobacteria bacterium UBA11367]HBE57003.1 hypothetical protein [Cyanobacteria bacterium UBA11366]HBK63259.1 hypothetical protein [Cyanobacteria bacterium UBA11166]HBR75263.1 hypothetical protein [Cyanobacteria bacterium UBA11159]HBS71447.1 hypothetical protein [Cyanobacteria bacterium UBA11153]HBW91633.1 hypothetical protein [Cyanobacteria bacterium UBA11149]HCA95562.1 hypothetical protein [Cyanobacteria bacterium UBA9226]